jgi:DNA-binding NarL/FixJ family response regulator
VEALVASLPGLQVVSLDAEPPAAVLLWAPPDQPTTAPVHDQATALLILTEEVEDLQQQPQAAGLFSRQEGPASLGVAIRQVARGQEYLSPSLALVLLQRREEQEQPTEPTAADFAALTEREQQVLQFLAQGLSNKEIAARLYLSVRTVEGHLANAYAKLDVHSRTEAALLAARLL